MNRKIEKAIRNHELCLCSDNVEEVIRDQLLMLGYKMNVDKRGKFIIHFRIGANDGNGSKV